MSTSRICETLGYGVLIGCAAAFSVAALASQGTAKESTQNTMIAVFGAFGFVGGVLKGANESRLRREDICPCVAPADPDDNNDYLRLDVPTTPAVTVHISPIANTDLIYDAPRYVP